MAKTLPDGFLTRPPTMDDLKATAKLVEACDIDEFGSPDITEDDMHSAWLTPHFNLATDAALVVAPDGRLAGYADIEHREHARLFFFGRVHPDFSGRCIHEYLLQMAETWAEPHIGQADPEARVSLNTWAGSVNEAAKQVFEEQGYRQVRRHWRMEVEMTKPPEVPAFPEGITLRPFVKGRDERMVFEMIDEAFADHWGHMPGIFENWKHWHIDREYFDPTLYFLAFDGDELAGSSLCTTQPDDLGWVDQLAVRRPWRRKGLGLVLLLHSFAEFYRRGKRKVGLGVDSQNLTGATRLYERAGMHIARQYDSYEKELRAGKELSTQSITL